LNNLPDAMRPTRRALLFVVGALAVVVGALVLSGREPEGAALAAAVSGALIRDAKRRREELPGRPPAPAPIDTRAARGEAEREAQEWLDR